MRRKILVVEDHSDARQMLSIALTKMGQDVLSAASGSIALNMIKKHRPAIVLMDIALGDALDGLMVCEKIKTDMDCHATFVIIMSGRKEKASIDEARRVGANAYLVKPFRLSKLLELVSSESFPLHTFTLVKEH